MVSRLAVSPSEELEQTRINTIRMLAVDAVQQSNSGHPGMPMDSAAMAYVLWSRYLRFNPRNPAWPNRDRFVLSAGHGSMLLYALLPLLRNTVVGLRSTPPPVRQARSPDRGRRRSPTPRTTSGRRLRRWIR